jgi:hypothetical protein
MRNEEWEEKEFSQRSGGMGMAHLMTENEFIERLRGIGFTNAELCASFLELLCIKYTGNNLIEYREGYLTLFLRRIILYL